jgi:hypothetical protein
MVISHWSLESAHFMYAGQKDNMSDIRYQTAEKQQKGNEK